MAETLNIKTDDYVRKEVFDAHMDRMEALLEKTLIEMKADNKKLRSEVNNAITRIQSDNEKIRSELRAEIIAVRGDTNMINAHISNLEMINYLGFTLVVLAVCISFLLLFRTLAEAFRPSVTMEDVEKAIDAALKQAAAQ